MYTEKMTAQMAAPPVYPAPFASNAGLLLSFDDVVADAQGLVSAADRCRLLRLFQALGGALAIFSDRSLGELDRALGLPDLPLIGDDGRESRLAGDLAAVRAGGMETLLNAPPFAGRSLLLFGRQGANSTLLRLVTERGGLCASGRAGREKLARWLERLAPVPADRRIIA